MRESSVACPLGRLADALAVERTAGERRGRAERRRRLPIAGIIHEKDFAELAMAVIWQFSEEFDRTLAATCPMGEIVQGIAF